MSSLVNTLWGLVYSIHYYAYESPLACMHMGHRRVIFGTARGRSSTATTSEFAHHHHGALRVRWMRIADIPPDNNVSDDVSYALLIVRVSQHESWCDVNK